MNPKQLESQRFRTALRDILRVKVDREVDVDYEDSINQGLGKKLTMIFWSPLQRQLVQDFYTQIQPKIFSNLQKLINKTEK